MKPADLAGQLGAFFDARAEVGRSRSGRQPLRRELIPALKDFESVTSLA